MVRNIEDPSAERIVSLVPEMSMQKTSYAGDRVSFKHTHGDGENVDLLYA